FEPPQVAPPEPKSGASASFATLARGSYGAKAGIGPPGEPRYAQRGWPWRAPPNGPPRRCESAGHDSTGPRTLPARGALRSPGRYGLEADLHRQQETVVRRVREALPRQVPVDQPEVQVQPVGRDIGESHGQQPRVLLERALVLLEADAEARTPGQLGVFPVQ